MTMRWEEHDIDGPGPKMLFPMAWSLLPLVGGFLLLIKDGENLLATSFVSAGIMLSLIAVWIGTTQMPGRVDMLVLMISPFSAFALFFQPPFIVQILVAMGAWTVNYRTAAMLSALAGKSYRLDWDVNKQIPHIESAKFFSRKWKPRPLFRLGTNVVRGVKIDGRTMLESDEPIQFLLEEG